MRRLLTVVVVLLVLLGPVGYYFSPLNMPYQMDFSQYFFPLPWQESKPSPVQIFIYTSSTCRVCYNSVTSSIFEPYFDKLGYYFPMAVDNPLYPEIADNLKKIELTALEASLASQMSPDTSRLIQLPVKGPTGIFELPLLPYVIIKIALGGKWVPIIGLSMSGGENGQPAQDLKAWLEKTSQSLESTFDPAFALYSADLVEYPAVWRLKSGPGTYTSLFSAKTNVRAGIRPLTFFSLNGLIWDESVTNIIPYTGYRQVPFFVWENISAWDCPEGYVRKSVNGGVKYASGEGFSFSFCSSSFAQSYDNPRACEEVGCIGVPYLEGASPETAGFRGYLIYPKKGEFLVRGSGPSDWGKSIYTLIKYSSKAAPIWTILVKVAVPTANGLVEGMVPFYDLEYVGPAADILLGKESASAKPDLYSLNISLPSLVTPTVPVSSTVEKKD